MRTRHGNLTQKARQLLSRHCHCHCFRGPAPSILLVWRRRLDKISDCGPSQFRPPAGCCSELLIYLRPNSCEQLRALRQLPACRSSTATSTFFSGSTPIQVNRGELKVTCKRAEVHPQFYNETKVYCNGELVMTTGGTQSEYVVDVWTGNHPFYQGNKSALVLDADRVEKFRQRYGGIGSIQEIPTLLSGEVVFQKKKKGPIKGGKGGKK
ncbi:uncharacterized protein [Physcomitrium patens]|uniref:Large ribosomal subunit protein bL31c n=2 Tax=Physcomitrium patens TaxID=3218 RepID=A0A2K1JL09_PHYPA|nr:uncharacterized protein LOC112290311 [Physcomitrium patens]PNR42240.1 hypothetical protein PHYPA_017069 [Physcomitrium patens]|eukprot:XP_024392230.1 uncharacterized protein LOC112290311 [Physcomitrella patens]